MTLMLNHLIGFGAASVESAAPAFPQSLFTAGVTGAYYEIADLSTLFQERTGGGTTPATVNGVVGTIRDKSGLGNHLAAPSDAARGILRQDGATYYVEYDATDDTYSTSTTFSFAYPAFVGVTVQKAAQGSSPCMVGFYGSSTNYLGVTNVASNSRASGAHRNPTNSTGSATGATNSFPVDTTKVIQVTAATNSIKFQSNADAEVTNTTTFDPANYTVTAPIQVFRAPTEGRRFYGGVFLMGKTMSTDDRNAARTWLGNLGGLSL